MYSVDFMQMWEKGIELTKELVDLYEEELFDYERLSVILVRSPLFMSKSDKTFQGIFEPQTCNEVVFVFFSEKLILGSIGDAGWNFS